MNFVWYFIILDTIIQVFRILITYEDLYKNFNLARNDSLTNYTKKLKTKYIVV